MSDERLKPCPFCGGEAKVAHEYTEEWKLAYVMCFRCGCSTLSAISEDTVIQAWNTRKPMERIVDKWRKCRCQYFNSLCVKCNNDICKVYGGTCRKYRIINLFKKLFKKSV